MSDIQILYEDGSSASWNLTNVVARSGGRRSGRVVLSENRASATRLHVSDRVFLSELFLRAPHIGRVSFKRPPFVLVSALASVAIGGVLLFYFGLPGFSRLVATMIPVAWEQPIGDALVAGVIDDYPVCRSEAGEAALQEILLSLRNASGSDMNYNVQVVKWSMQNAFAAPGGNIIFMSGLLEDMESPEEFAGVLAHEMGHTIKRHSMARIIQVLGLDVLLETFGLGGTDILELAAQVGGVLVIFKNSREDESEADQMAAEILLTAGIDPGGLKTFFQRLLDADPNAEEAPGNAVSIFSSHPQLAERIDAVEEVQDVAFRPALSPDGWAALKAICDDPKNDTEADDS